MTNQKEAKMPWQYYCEPDKRNIVAETKAELVEKVMEHANREHQMNMTHDQAVEAVDKDARQAAA